MSDPVIRVSATEALLKELHLARAAVQRSKTKLGPLPSIEKLIADISQARLTQSPALKLQEPPGGIETA